MPPPPVRSSRWFIYASTGLLVFLCLAVTLAGLLLLRKASGSLLAEIAGSSMEPSLQGPRVIIDCPKCKFTNRWTIDAWNPRFEVCCMCCNHKLETPDPPIIASGQRITYRALRWNRSPIQRFDTVVINSTNEQSREVKRVIGLPHEDVAIRDGRLWVNDTLISPTPSQFLRQAVLMRHWLADTPSSSLDLFLRSVHTPIHNNLPINAHDSHAYVAAQNYGVSFRFAMLDGQWKLRLRWIQSEPSISRVTTTPESGLEQRANSDAKLDSHRYFCDLEIASGESTELWVNGIPLAPNPHHRGWRSPWLNILSIDGTLHVGENYAMPWTTIGRRYDASEHEDRVASSTSAPHSADSQNEETIPLVSLEVLQGDPAIDRCLVYRGIVYRGYRDTDTQRFRPEDGFIVLGDNVSISEDSRGAGDASIRIHAQQMRGIVTPEQNDLDSLIRQTESLPKGICTRVE